MAVRTRTNASAAHHRPTPSTSSSTSSTDSNPFTLSRDQQSDLLRQFKPSSLPDPSDASPLLFLSPEELTALADKQEREKEEEADEYVEAFWEELVNALLWTIPFAFLFAGMDYAIHAQYGQTLVAREELNRLINVLPTLYVLTFVTSRPRSRAVLPPQVMQAALFLMCIASGITLIHITSKEGYLKVMRQAPALGTLWVWSVVRMDLLWAMGGLAGVAAAVFARGESDAVIYWK